MKCVLVMVNGLDCAHARVDNVLVMVTAYAGLLDDYDDVGENFVAHVYVEVVVMANGLAFVSNLADAAAAAGDDELHCQRLSVLGLGRSMQ